MNLTRFAAKQGTVTQKSTIAQDLTMAEQLSRDVQRQIEVERSKWAQEKNSIQRWCSKIEACVGGEKVRS